MGIRSAFPHLSPYPLMVPWTMLAPTVQAASGIGHGQSAVIMGMDAHISKGTMSDTSRVICLDLIGEGPAVGIAKDNHRGPGIRRRFYCLARVRAVIFIAVKEMLRVVYDFLSFRFKVFNAVADHAEVFFQWDAEDCPSHAGPRFSRRWSLSGSRHLSGRRYSRIHPAGYNISWCCRKPRAGHF